MKKNKHILCVLLTFLMMIGCIIPAGAAEDGLSNFVKVNSYQNGQFRDVSASKWFSVSVSSVYQYGLMIGMSANQFGPDTNLTIAQVYTIAARLHSIYYTAEENFGSSSPWYRVYSEYAVINGLESRYNKDSEMNKPAKRYQVADIIVSALPPEALDKKNTVEKNQIPDVPSSASYAPSVYKLYEAGITIGMDKYGNFCPDKTITRAEMAAITTRMIDRSLRQKTSFAVDDSVKPYSTTKETIYRFLTDNMQFTPAAACGIMGNIAQECSYNYNCTTGAAYGLFQWTNSRQQNLKDYCAANGLKYNTLEGQLRFFEYEMNKSYKQTMAELNAFPNTSESLKDTTELFEIRFERAGNPMMEKRIQYAQDAWNLYGSKDK